MVKTANGFAGRLDRKPFEQFGYRFEGCLLIAELVDLILVGNEPRKARALGWLECLGNRVQRIANFILVGFGVAHCSVWRALPPRCRRVANCVAMIVVAVLPRKLPFAVEKSSNLVRSRASH